MKSDRSIIPEISTDKLSDYCAGFTILTKNFDRKETEITLGDKKITLTTHHVYWLGEVGGIGSIVGVGGFKHVYDIGEGQALALLNVSVDGISNVERWYEAVYEEKWMSDRLASLGLVTQQYNVVEVKVDGHCMPALLMQSFEDLASHGKEVRDPKSGKAYGHVMLFNTIDNLISQDYLLKLMQPIVSDIACLIANGIALTSDSYNFVVTTCDEKPISEQKTLRLFLFDFASKNGSLFPYEQLEVKHKNGDFDIDKVAEWSELALNRVISSMRGCLIYEERRILGIQRVNQLLNENLASIKDRLLDQIKTRVISIGVLPLTQESPTFTDGLAYYPQQSLFVPAQSSTAKS